MHGGSGILLSFRNSVGTPSRRAGAAEIDRRASRGREVWRRPPAYRKPAYLGGELGKLLKVEVGVLFVLLGVNDHGLILVRQLARDARVLVRLIRAQRLSRDAYFTHWQTLPGLPDTTQKAAGQYHRLLAART
jgi:hypothetical protein